MYDKLMIFYLPEAIKAAPLDLYEAQSRHNSYEHWNINSAAADVLFIPALISKSISFFWGNYNFDEASGVTCDSSR